MNRGAIPAVLTLSAVMAVMALSAGPAPAQGKPKTRGLPQLIVPAPQRSGPVVSTPRRVIRPNAGANATAGVLGTLGIIGGQAGAGSDIGAVIGSDAAAPATDRTRGLQLESIVQPLSEAAPAPVEPVTLDIVEAGPVTLKSVTLPLSARVEVLLPSKDAYKSDVGQVLLEMAAHHVPDVILAGGYLSNFVPPISLGLIRVDGRDVSAAHESWLTTGLLCTTGGRATVLRYAPGAADGFEDCVQAGPMIVEAGVSRYPSSDLGDGEASLAERFVIHGFVCTDGAGRLVMGLSGDASLDELGPALVEALDCREAMRLTGSDTAGIYLRGTGLLGENRRGLPNAIAAFGVTVESDLR